MKDVLPASARVILERGVVCHLAVPAAGGPHLTPVVFVLDGGRLWLTTSRRSVKARAWRSDPRVAGLVRHEDGAVAFRGVVRTYDAFDVDSWPGAAIAGPRLVRAATRFSLKNARFFAGYALDARRLPLAWTPPGRVFAAVDLHAGWVLSLSSGSPTDRWGRWTAGAGVRSTFTALPGHRGVDLRVPQDVREAVGVEIPGTIALGDTRGLCVLPVAWRRVGREGAYDAVLPRSLFDLSGVQGHSASALTIDHASAWRASDMSGVMLRGPAEAFSPSTTRRGRAEVTERVRRAARRGRPPRAGPPVDDLVLIRLRPDRAVWWRGWAGGTVGGPRPLGGEGST